MVSPSKIQHQEQKQPSKKDKSRKQTHTPEQKTSKPLEGKSFYLDIKNHAITARIETRIKDLGGVIELFLVRSVNLVISDRVDKSGLINLERHKWGFANGGSGGIPSLRSLETPTPTPTPPMSFFSPEYPLSNTINLKGQSTQRSKSRVEAMLERALIQPQQCSVDPLYNAQTWGIPIWAIDKLQAWLDKTCTVAAKDSDNLKRLRQSNQQSSIKDLRVRHLRSPHLKFESFQRNCRPVFVELPVWPTLNFFGEPGSCPFNTKRREKPENLRKDIKENREAAQTIKQEEDKEMTRRPRTAARTRRTEQLASGYCEICRISYRDLAKHVQSDQHLSFVRNDDNFLSLDTLINAGANVEAFLKLNRGKDIEKSCSLFPNEDSNIQDTVLPNVKVNRNAKSLSDFEGEDIKMVQCNGARRNLNLKLNSSHNLRTRAKHESGHLLRSKGSPWHEAVKAEKLYDKFPGFTIKKRAKGTIWIEEDDPQDKFAGEQDIKGSRESEYKIKSFSAVLEEKHCNDKTYDAVCDKCNDSNNQDVHRTIACSNRENSIQNNAEPFPEDRSPGKCKNLEHINGNIKNGCNRNPLSTNVNIVEADKVSKVESSEESKSKVSTEVSRVKKSLEECIVSAGVGAVCNGHTVVEEQKDSKAWDNAGRNEPGKDDKLKCFKSSRRGSRSVRGRHRLSVEERLIEDNRAYYKVEVLGSKLRSSVLLNGNSQCTVHKPETDEEKKDVPSSEKPVVVRFKRVRKSELSLLSDEAESFMFGDLRRDDSSEASDGEQSSVLPKETESEPNDNTYPSSFLNSSLSIKSEGTEDESQDSLHMGRARKRRRTHTEALIKDNEDYYKFETPGSRLRFQAPLTGVKEEFPAIEHEKPEEPLAEVERVYPSKPSAEVEKMQFSFEAVPKSEPWYQTYQRQDEGAEFWHYFSDGDTQKPFLLPYEIENFHEILLKNQSRSESKRKGRGRSLGCIGRSPRKSPRCHASTLAIMSTIIRKREQQQSSNTYTIEECQSVRSQTSTPDQKSDPKSDVDEELKEMVRNIDEMLNNPNDSLEMVDSFEADVVQTEIVACEPNLPKGPPTNLLELLDSCHEVTSCLENSSCASSECGEGNVESPLKRRKKRKNRTGWPGIKTKKRLQSKVSIDMDCARENVLDKETGERNNLKDCKVRDMTNTIGIATVENGIRINTCVTISAEDEHLLGFSKWKEEGCLYQTCSTSHKRYEEKEDPKVCTDVHTNSLSRKNLESCTDTSCNETDGNLMINQEFTFGKPSTDIVEVSENDPGNDENHENIFRKDMNPMTERRFTSKSSPNKRRQQRENNSSETHVNTSRIEQIENELFCRKKDSAAGIVVPRKHHNDNGLTRKRQRTCHSEDPDTEIERRHRHHHHHHSYHHHSNVCKKSRVASRKRLYSRKRTRKGNMVVSSGTTTMYDDENCKKDSYLSITCRKGDNLKSGMKNSGGEAPPVSSNGQRSEVVDCSLTGHGVAPTTIMAATKLEQRRSSIEFQPVVRMMKIDDKVEMDHSILSVTIASNRRLRSSSSPRSNTQPPKKRLKTGRGQFGRWLKSS